MTQHDCGAVRFLRSRGPAALPLRACCAAALIHAASGADGTAPFLCAATRHDPQPTVEQVAAPGAGRGA
jgi:hypothetical protein